MYLYPTPVPGTGYEKDGIGEVFFNSSYHKKIKEFIKGVSLAMYYNSWLTCTHTIIFYVFKEKPQV